MSIDKKIDDLHSAVFGNGREGLVARMARVEAVQQMQVKYDDEFRAWIRKRFVIVIVLAIVAGGSPLANGLLEWFGIKGRPAAEVVAKEFPPVWAD